MPASPTRRHRARHGQLRQPDLRRAGGHGLQRPLRLHLLPPAVRVQPVRRPGALPPAARQRRTAPMAGATCWSRWSRATASGDMRRFFRGDAAFALPELYEYLEAEGYRYAIRLRPTRCCSARIEPSADAPGRPSAEPCPTASTPASATRPESGASRAGWWPRSNGIRASCIPRVGFIVTNLTPARRAGGRSSTTGAARPSSGSRKARTRSSGRGCPAARSTANAVRLQLHALAYNLANFLRTLACPSGGALVADDAAREAGQDRREGRRATPATWSSRWPRWRCPARCSRKS